MGANRRRLESWGEGEARACLSALSFLPLSWKLVRCFPGSSSSCIASSQSQLSPGYPRPGSTHCHCTQISCSRNGSPFLMCLCCLSVPLWLPSFSITRNLGCALTRMEPSTFCLTDFDPTNEATLLPFSSFCSHIPFCFYNFSSSNTFVVNLNLTPLKFLELFLYFCPDPSRYICVMIYRHLREVMKQLGQLL